MHANQLIEYLKNLGLDIHTSTKARGHQGFYMRKRIDISRNIPQDRVIPTLLHEFAHYVHSEIEPFIEKNGGSLNIIFKTQDAIEFERELLAVTNFVDSRSKCETLEAHKKVIKNRILGYEQIIKNKYPKFMRSKNFKEFDAYIKKSKARFLLKYDKVRLVSGFLFKKIEILSVDNIEKIFCDMPPEYAAYIRLHSCQKRQARVSAKINKLKKYYSRPTELFARFVEGLYIDKDYVKRLAPKTYKRFCELLIEGYYPNLSGVLELAFEK